MIKLALSCRVNFRVAKRDGRAEREELRYLTHLPWLSRSEQLAMSWAYSLL